MTFPAQIKQLRLALRLTQVELGALLDVSAQSICNWERGRSLPWEKDRGAYLADLFARLEFGPPPCIEFTSKGYGDIAAIKQAPRRRIGDML